MTMLTTYPIVRISPVEEDPNGACCGDYSVGMEASKRITWLTGEPDAPWLTLTVTYYVSAWSLSRTEGNKQLTDLDLEEITKDGEVGWEVCVQQEWIAHTDLDDPGSSEVDSRYVYESDGNPDWLDTQEQATEYAIAQAGDNNWHLWVPENWKAS